MPKRSDQRRRTNKPEIPIENADRTEDVSWPAPDAAWHPLATEWYLSLAKSATSVYYDNNDVAQARIVTHLVSEQLSRPGGAVANAIGPLFAAMNDFLTTEGARRKLRIEIARSDEQKIAPVLDIVDRREQLMHGTDE
jgi:hypothetical protein